MSSYIKNLFFILNIFISFQGFSQLSKTHYIPPLTSGPSNGEPRDQYIYISTPSNSFVPYTIQEVGGTTITGTVSNTTPQVITIHGTADGNGENSQLFLPLASTSTVTNNKGYIIEAEAPIYVSIRMRAGLSNNGTYAQAGALVSKGLSALDTTFRIGTYTSENPSDNYVSFVSVMATEDNTTVTFSNIPPGLQIETNTGSTTITVPVTITLNEGESYVIAIKGDENPGSLMDGLIGCLVASDKLIVVNCGSTNGSFDNGGGRDYGIDQIAGLSKIGNEYIFVRGEGNDAWENVLIVAHSNNTSISINGNAPVATINAGEYYVIEGNNYNANGNMYVATSENVFAYQGVGSNSEANQGMFFVPPLSCETRGNIDNIANIENIGSETYVGGVSIVTKTGATVTINNQPLTNFSSIGPSTVTGNADYITYTISDLTGNISVQGDDELYVAYFNVNGAATSGSFYSGFPSNPEINFDAQFAALGNCIPNITLEAANAQNFDSYEWYYDDGSGFQLLVSNVPSITPTIPGRYKLIGVITCTGETLESVEVPVSICPDDIDNDGIIDNLDIDNDNDGILNCTESRGDVIMDLSDTRDPRLQFQDGTVNNTIATDNIVLNRSGSGTSLIRLTGAGDIISEIPADSNAESNYNIAFTELVNVKLSEDTSYIHNSVDGEYFIAKISPLNKNITLVDPDDRLIVDSNFDGLFETGIIQISGSEIHFKYNPTPNGNTPFEFFANQIDEISFIHRLENIIENSNFQINISLTCFKKDNDNDGIKDELDLDSDNDGIPDFIENDSALVTLTGVDADLNGLDDVYDINATPIDTDTDSVYDFYDLDSDNDGIYDLIESGQLGTLSDTNLDGIEDGPSYGTNGWADGAETAPDSNLIGYIPNDFDVDTILSYIDLDSDGDSCSDVIEAGFSDANEDGLLGDNIVATDLNGLVNNATDGYTIPNSDYLDFAPITITTEPIDTESCELSTTVFSLVSSTYDTIQWEVSTDGINWNTIVDDAIYSGSQTTDLTISNTPLSYDTYQYRAFLNLAGNSCGLYSNEVELTVILLPIANIAPTILLCDDDNNGTMPFNLVSQNNAITTVSGMTITYHASQIDADNSANPITSPFESGNTTIYARVENDLNTTCFDTSSFDLEVYESPSPLLTVLPLQECDDTSVGTDIDGFKIFDLTQKETEILNGQSNTNFTLTYFTDAGYLNQILTPAAFTNTVLGGQTIYIRMTSNAYNACIVETSFDIEVFSLPIVNNPNIYQQCDDATNDGQAFFNLTLDTIKEEINTNYLTEGLTFTYYSLQSEAETATNAIANPSNYQDALGFTLETIWIRVENPSGCHRVVPLTLQVSPSSAALALYNPTSIYQCDDGLDVRDGISTFDMSNIQNYISNTVFSTFNVTVHFYESLTDAELENNEIFDIANHQNTNSPNTQSIWVRVKSDLGNNCLGLEEFPNLLVVEDLPVANPVTISRACDFDTTDTDVSYPFDTSLVEATVLGGQSLADVTINYSYLELDRTPRIANILPNPFLTETQTVTITLTNNTTLDPDGACYDETTLEFIVDEQPVIADIVTTQEVCDGDTGDIDDDGFYPFDTSTFTSTIIGTQSSMEIYYDYIDENGNQVLDGATLPNPLVSENQIITVDVINPINTNCLANTTIELIVNPLPEFNLDSPHIVCTSDPTFFVDLDPIEVNINEIFTYEWYFEDGSFLSNESTLTVSMPGTYSITLTKTDGTGCSRTRDFVVEASEIATITSDDITIVDISENNSVTIDTTNLGSGDYDFALQEENSTFIIYQEVPFFENVKAGFYTIHIRDAICGITTLNISVIGHVKYFTPNGDGINDFWQIKGVSDAFQPNSAIQIYDRYGKLLKQLSTLQEGWDGTFNGVLMPTDDYWFRVYLEDGREFSGHFTLKR